MARPPQARNKSSSLALWLLVSPHRHEFRDRPPGARNLIGITPESLMISQPKDLICCSACCRSSTSMAKW